MILSVYYDPSTWKPLRIVSRRNADISGAIIAFHTAMDYLDGGAVHIAYHVSELERTRLKTFRDEGKSLVRSDDRRAGWSLPFDEFHANDV